ncbi:hypothetical protein BDV41DRAFT_312435 [Aspergillus transmontanensis]|uniref:Uncharacterized protein n=1 Tax=Aspergillus transmontanensis TaxID=1034304 RepID=A0A5N6VXR2_9EURO|nr:hypothetical protein BDV41DRAFT_312435 [Aspergillus transmontanensis]
MSMWRKLETNPSSTKNCKAVKPRYVAFYGALARFLSSFIRRTKLQFPVILSNSIVGSNIFRCLPTHLCGDFLRVTKPDKIIPLLALVTPRALDMKPLPVAISTKVTGTLLKAPIYLPTELIPNCPKWTRANLLRIFPAISMALTFLTCCGVKPPIFTI